MWIVRFAFRRPLSVAVMATLMLVLGVLSFGIMNVDIFPSIDLPVVMVVWNYPGLSSFDVERRIVFITERAFSTTVNGIEHIESRSIQGVGLMKVYFHPGETTAGGIAQMTSVTQGIVRSCRREFRRPTLSTTTRRTFRSRNSTFRARLLSAAGAVRLWAELHPPQAVYDRRAFVAVALRRTQPRHHGRISIPRRCMRTRCLPIDISNALNLTNVILPAGSVKIGDREYYVEPEQGSPDTSRNSTSCR